MRRNFPQGVSRLLSTNGSHLSRIERRRGSNAENGGERRIARSVWSACVFHRFCWNDVVALDQLASEREAAEYARTPNAPRAWVAAPPRCARAPASGVIAPKKELANMSYVLA